MQLLFLICFGLTVCGALFPRPGLPDTTECGNCACTTDNWVCNVKCPNQQVGTREVCSLTTRSEDGHHVSPQEEEAILQGSQNFCEEGLLLNEVSNFAVGNFFLSHDQFDPTGGLNCFSIRLGDAEKRQKLLFDLYPPLKNEEGMDFVVFERGNGTQDGVFPASEHTSYPIPPDSYFPEAFATSFKSNGHWTPYHYFGVHEFVTFLSSNNMVPDWQHPHIDYNAFFDAWATVIDFDDYGIPVGQEVEAVSIINLLPTDEIKSQDGEEGEVVFSQYVDSICSPGQCVSPVIKGTQRIFHQDEHDPDIVWIAPFRGYYPHKK